MHEMSYIAKIADLAIDIARKSGAKVVHKVVVQIGKTSGVLPYYMYKYYPEAVKDTVLEGSELVCEEVEVKACCDECGTQYNPKKELNYLCPNCGGRKAHIIEGRGVTLKDIVIE